MHAVNCVGAARTGWWRGGRLLALLLCLLVGAVPAARAGAPPIVRVGYTDTSIFTHLDERGQPEGFCVDVLQEVAREEGWHLRFVHGTWPECLERLRTGQVDVLLPIFSTPERQAQFDFSEQALFTTCGRAFVRRDRPVSAIFDLKGSTVAVIRGDVFGQDFRTQARQFDLACQFIELDNDDELCAAVLSGRAQVGILENFDGVHLINQHAFPLVPTPVVFSPGAALAAVPKDRAAFVLTGLNRRLAALKADRASPYYEAWDKWLRLSPRSAVAPWVYGVLGGTVLLLALFAGLNRMLRAQVQAKTQALQRQNLALGQEIAERRQAEDSLRASEQRYRALVETTSDWVWEINRDGFYVYTNPRVMDLLGYAPEEIIGKRPFHFMDPLEAARVSDLFWSLSQRGQPIVALENTNRHRDGHEVVLETNGVPIFDEHGELRGYRGVDRDITARKRVVAGAQRLAEELELRVAQRTTELAAANHAVEERSRQLRRLAAELSDAEQRERRRLAHVLHEELQQLLVAVSFQLARLRQTAPTPEAQRTGAEAEQTLADALAVTRSLTMQLRPPVLYELGLVPALEWLASDLRAKYALAVTVTAADALPATPDSLRIFLYEAVRELLFNVVKHAQVQEAAVHLTAAPGDLLRLEVTDAGAGFDRASAGPGGFGLLNIRERLTLLGGALELHTTPGRGTRLVLLVPTG